jgi:hypothetical protein
MLVQRRAAGKGDHGTAPNLNAVANGLGVHPSNATRAVDRLVSAGLLDRSDDPTDRRNLVFELTRSGRDLVDHVMDRRRAAIAAILARMPPVGGAPWCRSCGPSRAARRPTMPSGRWAGPSVDLVRLRSS